MNAPFPILKSAEIVGIQLTVLVIIHLASGAHRSESDSDANVFRVVPGIAWLVAIACPLISAVYAICAFVTQYHHKRMFIMFSLLFFVAALYGVYCLSLRIRLNEDSLLVTSCFGARITPFSEIESIEDKGTSRTRILKVNNKRGKQILYAAEWYIADYATLVDLLRDGTLLAKKSNDRV